MIFFMCDYLVSWENDEDSIDYDTLIFMYDNYVNKNTLHSLAFEAFLRQTDSTYIKAERDFLYQKVGEQTIRFDWLKKNLGIEE